jgi:hypothetical protein
LVPPSLLLLDSISSKNSKHRTGASVVVEVGVEFDVLYETDEEAEDDDDLFRTDRFSSLIKAVVLSWTVSWSV